MRLPGLRALVATTIVVLGVAVPGLEGRALAQPCITCRTEKCPNKRGLSDWCGKGKDPLAKETPSTGNEPHVPTARKFKVLFETQPPGARIDVSGTPAAGACTTPCALQLPKGKYHVVVALTEYDTLEKDIEVSQAERNHYDLVKRPVISTVPVGPPPKTVARLEVRSAPDQSARGASVFLDGKAMQAIPAVIDVEPGKRKLDVTRPGYTEYHDVLDVAAGEKRVVEVALRARTGNLLVIANVAEATVSVDGTKRDVAPVSLNGLAEGKHTVEVTRPGFTTFRKEIDVAAGSDMKLRADIAPLPREISPAELAAIAARQRHERVMLILEQSLLHPASVTFQPVMLTEFHPNPSMKNPSYMMPPNNRQTVCDKTIHSRAFADCDGGVSDQAGAELSVRFTWLEADVGVIGWANPTSKWIARYSVGLSPVTLGTWLGKEGTLGVTLLEPFVLYRWYNASGPLASSINPMQATPPDVHSIVVGNRVMAELGPVGIGVEVSGEFGLDGGNDGFDWALNAGIVIRVGSR